MSGWLPPKPSRWGRCFREAAGGGRPARRSRREPEGRRRLLLQARCYGALTGSLCLLHTARWKASLARGVVVHPGRSLARMEGHLVADCVWKVPVREPAGEDRSLVPGRSTPAVLVARRKVTRCRKVLGSAAADQTPRTGSLHELSISVWHTGGTWLKEGMLFLDMVWNRSRLTLLLVHCGAVGMFPSESARYQKRVQSREERCNKDALLLSGQNSKQRRYSRLQQARQD